MAYFAPYIDQTGYHMPTYTDIINQLVSSAQTIFGQDMYLGIDSQDYQFMSAIAKMIYDAFLTAQTVYNSYGPGTAIGAALDTIVKINGLQREVETYSTVSVTLTGTPGTPINSGVVQDTNGIKWDLPSQVTIGSDGNISATVTCEQPGSITVSPGQISTIVTPTYGWTSVTNSSTNSTIGTNIEQDSALRGRQAQSSAIPSKTILDGLKALIAATPGVTRSEVYENFTSSVNSLGIPANSIACVVEGGSDGDVANAIYLKRGLGCGTYGATIVTIQDSYNQLTPINFNRPSYVDIDVVVNVKKLNGYTTQTTTAIQNAIANFLNGFSIGTSLNNSGLWGAALSANTALNNPTFSITSLTMAMHGGTQGTSDIPITFNQVLRGNTAYITVNPS
jgi:uncharacterized phage protein gp47/JayE